MTSYGDYVSNADESLRFDRDTDGSIIRIFLHEDVYNVLMPIYDYFSRGSSFVSVDKWRLASGFVELYAEIASRFVLDFPSFLGLIRINFLALIVHELVLAGISIKKFGYEIGARVGMQLGEFKLGGVKITDPSADE